MVMDTLDYYELDPAFLELEITETILMESFEATVTKLERLKEEGVRIALGDFGKGYSSLSYLKQLPISTLKIDKSFIDSISIENENTWKYRLRSSVQDPDQKLSCLPSGSKLAIKSKTSLVSLMIPLLLQISFTSRSSFWLRGLFIP